MDARNSAKPADELQLQSKLFYNTGGARDE
jgi:hypothetical protein